MHRRGFTLGSLSTISTIVCPTLRLSAQQLDDPSWEVDFAKFVNDGLAATKTPGMSVAIIKDGRTSFSRGYGYADIQAKKPVTPDTAFHIASVSKTVTGAAMMMLWQDSGFQLDDPIGRYLDFPVAHPAFPDTPITFKQLFTHTSGISDKVYGKVHFFVQGDPTLSLRDFLIGYLTPGGQWYEADASYSTARPGTAWSYSNVAVALLGYMAGRVGKLDLNTLTRQRIFEPLGMLSTAWKFADLRTADIALPYQFSKGDVHVVPTVGYPDWPAGLLRTSANDFARFLAIFTSDGRVGSKEYLSPESIRAILTPAADVHPWGTPTLQQGLIWELNNAGDHQVVSKDGADLGAMSLTVFDVDSKAGVLVFANISGNNDAYPLRKATMQRLLDRARLT